MLKALYYRHQYFFNMLAVLIFLVITRMLDSFAWMPPDSKKTEIIIANSLFEFLSFLPFIFLFIFCYSWALKRELPFLLYSFIIVFTVFGPAVFLLLSTWLEDAVWNKEVLPFTFDLVKKYSPGISLVLLFLSAAFYFTFLKLRSARQLEEMHRAESLAKDVQLKMLRYQINPHFLFNVLNSIYTLIDENTVKARKLVLDMAEYYRYTLNKQEQTISIEKEVESIVKYLEIQKTRFEEEFQYEISVDEEVRSILIPSFLIHLLIENAVKYGTKTMKQKLVIHLSAKILNKNLLISVSNTGKLLNTTQSNGKNIDGTSNGIENLNQRLGLYYNDNYTFSLKEEEGWVIAAVEIREIKTR
ncbi:MAG: histidine kinase [Bacteroidales bacterium]|nr:histidine kinase [Bacteroidales bacterium]